MNLKKILLASALFSSFLCNAQNPNIKRTWHWYFGDYCGVDFSSGIAIADTAGQFHGNEGGSSISDTNGNLLFYTNGNTVWNHLNQLMPHGINLLGGAGSSTQAALIVPKPQSNNLYFIFTTDQTENGGVNGMRYSVVDMNLDGGNGDVDSTQKNILLCSGRQN